MSKKSRLTTAERREMQAVLKTDSRQFLESRPMRMTSTSDAEEELACGPHAISTRKTFERAKPIIDELINQYPTVDHRLVLACLKSQTVLAETRSDQDHKKQILAWKKLWQAWDEFCRAAFGTVTLQQLRDTVKTQRRKGVEFDDPDPEMWLWQNYYKKTEGFLDELQELFNLPAPGQKGRRGRPSSWWSDVYALRLQDHFYEKTGTPQRKMIAKLLSCAPKIPGALMTPEHIRQRLSKHKRDSSNIQIMRLVGTKSR